MDVVQIADSLTWILSASPKQLAQKLFFFTDEKLQFFL